MFNPNYYLNLIRNQPIVYNGLTMYIVPLKQICEYGVERYDNLILPFSLTPKCFNRPIESILRQGILANLDLFNSFVEMLSLVTHYDVCRPTQEYIDLKLDDGSEFRIDDSNFEDICDIILKMNAKGRIEITEKPQNASARVNDVWEKLEKGRKRYAEKNKVNLWDMLNVCEFAGDYHISIGEMDEWSLWKITNCYKARIGWKSYDDAFEVAMVSGETKDISDENHWFKRFMVRE